MGAKALERVLRKLGREKVKSGYYTMVVDHMNVEKLLSPMLSALYGSALPQKTSFLIDKLDTKVAFDLFPLRDEPHAICANGSR